MSVNSELVQQFINTQKEIEKHVKTLEELNVSKEPDFSGTVERMEKFLLAKTEYENLKKLQNFINQSVDDSFISIRDENSKEYVQKNIINCEKFRFQYQQWSSKHGLWASGATCTMCQNSHHNPTINGIVNQEQCLHVHEFNSSLILVKIYLNHATKALNHFEYLQNKKKQERMHLNLLQQKHAQEISEKLRDFNNMYGGYNRK